MIYIKDEAEIKAIRAGGQQLAKILQVLVAMVKPGCQTAEIEAKAIKLIKQAGGRPAFLNYPLGGGIFFPSAVCLSINNEVVHGSTLPNRTIVSGDVVDIDIGMEWPTDTKLRQTLNLPLNKYSSGGGFYTDTCATVGAGKISAPARKLLEQTRISLTAGIAQAKVGNRLSDIALAISQVAKKHGYGVVEDLVGHGVGYYAHEDPNVFNYEIPLRSSENYQLKAGMVLAIEPMFNLGKKEVAIADNDFTIITADGSISAHFEHTVAITANGPVILTKDS